MTDAQAPELKPCPFCDGEMQWSREPHDNHPVAGMYYLYHKGGSQGCRLKFDGHFRSFDEMRDAWNTRSGQLVVNEWRPIAEAQPKSSYTEMLALWHEMGGLREKVGALKAEVDAWEQVRTAVIDLEGLPDNWPEHGNAPLAITAAYALKNSHIEALEAQPVKVKALQWRRESRSEWWGKGFGDIFIIYGWMYIDSYPDRNHYEYGGQRFDILEEAKAAAQADYEKRILSALDTTTKETE